MLESKVATPLALEDFPFVMQSAFQIPDFLNNTDNEEEILERKFNNNLENSDD